MATKLIAVQDLTPGVIVANEVISDNGKVLLEAGIELTFRHISLLRTWGIDMVAIADGTAEEPTSSNQLPGSRSSVNSSAVLDCLKFNERLDTLVTGISHTFKLIETQNVLPINYLKGTAGKIHTSILEEGLAGFNSLLIGDRKLSDLISQHAVMVAFLAANLARKLNWSEKDIQGVALSALLHDIGALADGERGDDRQRIAKAASLLKGVAEVSREVILGVVQHRQCLSSAMLPDIVQSMEIHPYAKLIAIVDFFHEQTYRDDDRINPFPVLDRMNSELLGKLDIAMSLVFIQQVKDSLLNNRVLLTDGREAIIIYFQPTGSCQPIVRADDGEVLDLTQTDHESVQIMRLSAP